MSLVLRGITRHEFGLSSVVGTDRVRSGGRFVGYGATTVRYFSLENRVVARIALAFRNGTIVGRVSAQGSDTRFSGPILHGTGDYAGVQGRMSGRPTNGPVTFVTLRYQL